MEKTTTWLVLLVLVLVAPPGQSEPTGNEEPEDPEEYPYCNPVAITSRFPFVAVFLNCVWPPPF